MKTQKSNQYRLLQETIRLIIREDIRVGDIKAALAATKKAKNFKQAGAMLKTAGKATAMSILGMFPGAGTISAALQAGMEFKDIYDAAKDLDPKEKEANPLWDLLTIDPETSAIVDNGVESDFISTLADKANMLDDDDELPDADTQLAGYLKGKYSGTYIKK